MVIYLHHLFSWLMHNIMYYYSAWKIITHNIILFYCHMEPTEWYIRSNKLTAIAQQSEQHQATQENIDQAFIITKSTARILHHSISIENYLLQP